MARKKLTQEQKEARVKILAKAREKRFKENPPQYKNICPDVLSLPDDAPMSFAKVKQWIKTLRLEFFFSLSRISKVFISAFLV